MTRKFGKKITLMGLLVACILMATASAAMAVVVLGNIAPVVGYKPINTLPGMDAQLVTPGAAISIATVDVLLSTATLGCPAGNIPVDLIIHDVTAGGLTIATANATMPTCYTGNVSFAFPGLRPLMNGVNQYDLQINTPANPAITTLYWAYTANIMNPQINNSIWDFAGRPGNDYRFRLHI